MILPSIQFGKSPLKKTRLGDPLNLPDWRNNIYILNSNSHFDLFVASIHCVTITACLRDGRTKYQKKWARQQKICFFNRWTGRLRKKRRMSSIFGRKRSQLNQPSRRICRKRVQKRLICCWFTIYWEKDTCKISHWGRSNKQLKNLLTSINWQNFRSNHDKESNSNDNSAVLHSSAVVCCEVNIDVDAFW